MRITVQHRTAYTFTTPVFLEPHIIRLRPRSDAAIRLVEFALNIDPVPSQRAENLDVEGNVVTHAWFEGKTTGLVIQTRAVVDTLVTDPFQFLGTQAGSSDPAPALDPRDRLTPYRGAPGTSHPSVQALALETLREADRDRTPFPLMLARRLHRQVVQEERPEGLPLAPEVTLTTRRGACRDVAVLFVECCRVTGLAARFASGYFYTGVSAPSQLHAWGEVYLAGGGWRGYDPSHGLAVADRHVTVAAAAEPLDASPVTGTFRGDQAAARLETEVTLEATPA